MAVSPRKIFFLTAPDLEKLCGNRSLSSCRRDYRYLRDLFELTDKRLPGIPINLYAEYTGIPVAYLHERLNE